MQSVYLKLSILCQKILQRLLSPAPAVSAFTAHLIASIFGDAAEPLPLAPAPSGGLLKFRRFVSVHLAKSLALMRASESPPRASGAGLIKTGVKNPQKRERRKPGAAGDSRKKATRKGSPEKTVETDPSGPPETRPATGLDSGDFEQIESFRKELLRNNQFGIISDRYMDHFMFLRFKVQYFNHRLRELEDFFHVQFLKKKQAATGAKRGFEEFMSGGGPGASGGPRFQCKKKKK